MQLYLIFLGFGIITHVIRTVYEILKVRDKINPEAKGLFPVIFANMALLWTSWFLFCETNPDKITLPAALIWTGAALNFAGLVLFGVSLLQTKKLENYHGDLITAGIYKYLRHPMYLGFLCWLAGGALFYTSALTMVMAVVFGMNVLVWKYLEEIQLRRVYPEYDEYRKRTLF